MAPLLVFSIFVLINKVFSFQSPCPENFQYFYDNNRLLCGLISIPIPNHFGNLIQVKVKFEVGHRLDMTLTKSIGKVVVMDTSDVVLQKIKANQPISFKLEFPTWYNLIPKVTKISVNDNEICSGSSIPSDAAESVTTVNLLYNLTITYTKNSKPHNYFPPQNNQNNNINTHFNPQSWNQRPTNQPEPQQIQNNSINTYYYTPPWDARPTNQPEPQKPQNNGINTFLQQPSWNARPTNQPEPQKPQNNGINTHFQQPPWNQNPTNEPKPQTPQNNFYASSWNPRPTIAPTPPTSSIHIRTKPTDFNSLQYICGFEDQGISLIYGGQDVKKSDHPWLGALYKTTTSEAKFLCGATLVTKKHALTAGHCIHGTAPRRLHLIVGRENIQNWLSEGEQIQLTNAITHEDFVVRQGDGDLGLLVLSREIKLSFSVRPICLWSGNDDENLIVGKEGTVVGWGENEKGVTATTPSQVTMPVVKNEDCIRSNPIFSIITSERTFCAGNRNNSGPCNGDSGSGFYVKQNNKWSLRGIVSQALSANEKCDLSNYVVFVDVAKYKDWIIAKIKNQEASKL